MNSPAAIYKDLAIVQGNKAWIRAWNIRTGTLVWTFNLIAQPGDPGHETWEQESWKDPGDTNVWGFLSLDASRGLVFLPNSMPGSNDYYGGTRHGDNLYGTSVIAVDADTGRLRWYRQLVHHDIWDYDLGAAPALVDVVKNGKMIPAVAQITKMGLLFVLDRTTGEPVWGVEERPVPQSTAPGEKTAPTQPPVARTLARNSTKRTSRQSRPSTRRTRASGRAYGLQDRCLHAGATSTTSCSSRAVGGGNWNGSPEPAAWPQDHERHERQWGHLELATGRGAR
jgi:quinoprotein glucose dehydrogenase